MPTEDNNTTIDREIIAHYESMDEARRLEKTESEIERLRTQELLQRYLPAPPAVILDVVVERPEERCRATEDHRIENS